MNFSSLRARGADLLAVEQATELLRSSGVATSSTDGVVYAPAELRRAIQGRRLRDHFFGAGIFEEPAWDMMLELFASELECGVVSVSALCMASAVAPTTALRWINKLTEAGMLERKPDPFDRRRSHVELSEKTSVAMRRYIETMRRTGLALS